MVPKFIVINIAYKSIPVSQLFSTNSKASIPYEETPNICYQFICECSSSYIGHSDRSLIERMREHQQPSRMTNIFKHIRTCPEFLGKRNIYRSTNRKKLTSQERNFEYFKNHFKILQKSFLSTFERRKTEAFYIRVKRPDLNDQKDHNFFKLFQRVPAYFLVFP